MTNSENFGVFYKYREVPPEGTDRYNFLYELIAKRSLYFSKPDQLNDPFDCYPTMSLGSTRQKKRQSLSKLIRKTSRDRGLPKLDDIELEKEINRFLREYVDQDRLNKVVYGSISRTTGVFSLSKSCLSIPQWTYYADSHRGIVLELNMQKHHHLPFSFDVSYEDERVEIDYIRYTEDEEYMQQVTVEFLTRKTKDWKHEKEVRLIDFLLGQFTRNQRMEYPKECLVGVGFGLDTSLESKNLIKEWVQESGCDPEYFTVELDSKMSKLNRICI